MLTLFYFASILIILHFLPLSNIPGMNRVSVVIYSLNSFLWRVAFCGGFLYVISFWLTRFSFFLRSKIMKEKQILSMEEARRMKPALIPIFDKNTTSAKVALLRAKNLAFDLELGDFDEAFSRRRTKNS